MGSEALTGAPPWLSVAPDFEQPTVLVFDLDPGEGAGLLDAAEIALVLHRALRGDSPTDGPVSGG